MNIPTAPDPYRVALVATLTSINSVYGCGKILYIHHSDMTPGGTVLVMTQDGNISRNSYTILPGNKVRYRSRTRVIK